MSKNDESKRATEYQCQKQFIAETLGSGEHFLAIPQGEPTKVNIFDAGYDEDGQHECEVEIYEEGIQVEDVIQFLERDRRILGKYDLLPPTVEEYQAMKESIKKHGVLVPILVDQYGDVVEGKIRKQIAEDLGINCPTITMRINSAQHKLELAYELNSCRKHHNQKDKARIVKSVLSRMTDLTDRKLARLTGVCARTIAKYRKQLLEKGAIRNCPERKGIDGKTYRMPSIVTNTKRDHEQALEAIGRLPSSANGKIIDITTANRRANKYRKAKTAFNLPTGEYVPQIIHCPFQELETRAGIASSSAKLVLTDIPYGVAFLDQLEELAQFADRVLMNGGVIASYVGTIALPTVMEIMGRYLNYRWLIPSAWSKEGATVTIPNFGIAFSHHKPIVIYSKGQTQRQHVFRDLFLDSPKEKEWHEWQQPVGEAEKLLEYFSEPGDLVVEPCGGGFTTSVACMRTGRRNIACDVDAVAVENGRQRVAEELHKKNLNVSA